MSARGSNVVSVDPPRLRMRLNNVQMVRVGDISVVWVKAQRGLSSTKVADIVDNFDERLFGVLTVTEPVDGMMRHAIDGQHRASAVLQKFGPDMEVPCNILNVTDPKVAADLFFRLNTTRTKPNSVERFNVAVLAEYPAQVAVNDMVMEYGYHVSSGQSAGSFSAVESAVRIYAKRGEDHFREIMELVTDVWGVQQGAVDGLIIRGFSRFFLKHGDNKKFDRTSLISQLQRKCPFPNSFVGAAKQVRGMTHTAADAATCAYMEGLYNEKKKTYKLR